MEQKAQERGVRGRGLDIAVLRELLLDQSRLLDALIHRIAGPEAGRGATPDVMRVTVLMIQALGVSLHSILRLTETKDMAIRDAYGIARSASELGVNICYIGAVGDDAAQRADRHAMQKRYRDLHRAGAIGGIGFELRSAHKPAIDEVPGLQAALAEFTGRKGQEITDWTPLSISDRIEAVARVHSGAALALTGSTISIYRHAAELLHGTYFSVLHFWAGSSSPAVTREQFDDRWEEHFVAIFTAAYFAAQATVELFAQLYFAPELAKAQKEMMLRVNEQIVRSTQEHPA